MKMRRSIFWFIIIVMAALIVLVLWHGKKKPTETPTTTAVETNVVPPATAAPSAPVSAPVHMNTPPAQLATNAAMPSNQTKGEPMKEGLAEMN
ncbi:MAG: hypothetical protein ACREDS_11465, partial [Limisphaerales bacterium]